MPCIGSRKDTENAPAVALLTSGVLYAFQVLPPSAVARILAVLAPPVAAQAFLIPCVAMQVPLEENDASPCSAGGMLPLILFQVVPSEVRRSGKTPFTESLCTIARFGVQNAKQS